ncbi:hypothetical protein M885DRAFT_510022 [Pelagophyceae sp. CCMP2097]|nr:hypothetical protein M885DRAFT_510022 [Pelagophyceae sp. CCMP2097]
MRGQQYRASGEVALPANHVGWRDKCGWLDLFCYEGGRDSSTIQNAATTLFVALAVAWAVCVATAYSSQRGGARKWKLHWSGVTLGLLCCTQYYFIFRAANIFPYTYNDDLVLRYDCLHSTKGGKISDLDAENTAESLMNPCFCHATARCRIRATNAFIDPLTCPRDGTAECSEQDGYIIGRQGGKKEQRTDRDCKQGRGSKCTKEEPCTPCDLDELATGYDQFFCAFCTDVNKGDCKFRQDTGPYCYASPGSRDVVPCKRCCTPPLVDFTGPFPSPNGGPDYFQCRFRYKGVDFGHY